jgi:hypothetical protein
MTPAPIDVIAAMARPGTRVVDEPESDSGSTGVGSTRSPSLGTVRVMPGLYEDPAAVG